MSSLKPEIIREIGFRLLSENSDRFLSTAVQNFMLASKEGFDVVLQAFRQTTFVYIEPEGYVETRLTLNERNICLRLRYDDWYFKLLFKLAASSMKKLHISYTTYDDILPITKPINNEVELVEIQGSYRLNKLFEALNGMTNVVEKVYIDVLSHEMKFLKEDLSLFSIPCRTLVLTTKYSEKFKDFGNWKNKCLHQVRHLILKGDSSFVFTKDVKKFMTFISVNFPKLDTLKMDFKVQHLSRRYYWDWNNSELPKFLNILFPSVKGFINFLIVNSVWRHVRTISGLQLRYDRYHHSICYVKDLSVHTNLILRLAFCNK